MSAEITRDEANTIVREVALALSTNDGAQLIMAQGRAAATAGLERLYQMTFDVIGTGQTIRDTNADIQRVLDAEDFDLERDKLGITSTLQLTSILIQAMNAALQETLDYVSNVSREALGQAVAQYTDYDRDTFMAALPVADVGLFEEVVLEAQRGNQPATSDVPGGLYL